MYEYMNKNSFWKPYLDLVPDITILDQPIFWGLEERQKEPKGTDIEEDVENDVKRIEEEYNTIVLPFMKKQKQHFRYKDTNCSLVFLRAFCQPCTSLGCSPLLEAVNPKRSISHFQTIVQ